MILRAGDLVLLDRDGVLNVDRPDSVRSPEQLLTIPRAGQAVARFNRAGMHVAVVTNQSVIGRGLIDETMLERIHAKLRHELAQEGGKLDAIFHCPDAPDAATAWRKPGPEMLRDAMRRFQVARDRTVMIGDSLRDLQAAEAAGCHRVLVRTGKGRDTQAAGLPPELSPISIYEDIWETAAALLGDESDREAS